MYALLNGYLFGDPEEKTSKAGKPYVKATLKEGRGDETIFVSVTAFQGTTADALLLGKDGDAVNIMGELKLRCYEKNGEWRPAADVIANKVTLLAKPARPQAELRTRDETRTPPRRTADAIDDDIPF
jgi:single-stranded DNA-binding protein